MKAPQRFQNAQYGHLPEDIKKRFDGMQKTKRGMYIHGPVGVGKTHILYAMSNHMNEVAQKAREKLMIGYPTTLIYNATDMLRQIKRAFDNRVETDVLDRILTFNGVLMLDDVGSEKMTEWVAETFYLIINNRYENMMPVVITSNYNLKDQSERIGDRTVSRIVEMCDVIELLGKDKRLNQQNKISIKA